MNATKNHIPAEVRGLLKKTRFGITFPHATGCQMRLIHHGKNLGRYYNYKEWGGVRKAVEAAINRNKQLRALLNRNVTGKPRIRDFRSNRSNTGVLGVSKNTYYDKRRGRSYIRYMASWRRDHRNLNKGFHISETATTDQHLHALRTAIQFRAEWESLGNQFSPTRFQLWRTKRLYEQGDPDLPLNFFEQGSAP